ncbi:MAG: hypothetical protein ABIP42_18025 [Planctomycetota bacterium]
MDDSETPADIIRRLAPSGPVETLRDRFAMSVMPECIRIADDHITERKPNLSDLFGRAAVYAYFAADAMLIARLNEDQR